MKEIVVNRCYGGFGLSFNAVKRYAELKGIKAFPYIQSKHKWREGEDEYKLAHNESETENTTLQLVFWLLTDYGELLSEFPEDAEWLNERDIPRDDVCLVKVIGELGVKANGRFSELEITTIPDNVEWEIEDYDGREWVSERHRTW